MATVVFGAFEWDDRKAALNLRKHGVSFEEAVTALADPRAIEAPDLVDSGRWITIGYSALQRALFVVHTEAIPGGRTRLITARKASPPNGGSMKKAEPAKLPEGHLGRYDWAKARRGRLAAKAKKASALLRILAPDLAARFPDSRSVNDALRALLALDAALRRGQTARRRAA